MNRSRSLISLLPLLGAALLPAALLPAACAKQENFGGPQLCMGAGCPDASPPLSDAGLAPGPDASAVTSASAGFPNVAPSAPVGPADPVPRTTPDAVDQAIEVALRQQALKLAAKGALPDSQVLRVDLAEGQRSGMVFTLQPNTCYTIIAAGAPVIVGELEVKLLLPPFFTMEAGKGRGQPAAIGKSPTPICPISPIALPYKIEVAATKGGGRVGVMVFAKPR